MSFSVRIPILTRIWPNTPIWSQIWFLSPLARVLAWFWSSWQCKPNASETWEGQKEPDLTFFQPSYLFWPESDLKPKSRPKVGFWALQPEFWPVFALASSANPRHQMTSQGQKYAKPGFSQPGSHFDHNLAPNPNLLSKSSFVPSSPSRVMACFFVPQGVQSEANPIPQRAKNSQIDFSLAKIPILTRTWPQTQICSQTRFSSPLARVMACFFFHQRVQTQGRLWLQRAKNC